MLILAGPSGASGHDGGPLHPEQLGRIFSVMEGVRDLRIEDGIVYTPIVPATLDQLALVHDRGYLAKLERFCQTGGGDLDADTYARPDSFDMAKKAAGAGLAAISALEEGSGETAFVVARPPGHHALRDRAMGFCLLNNIAVAASSLVAKGQRVLIVDWDVHHGNGTQEMFWNEPNVLFVSTHQWPLYPGTGRAQEIGGPEATDLTVNLPLPAGATGDVVQRALEDVAAPLIDSFAPDWVLVSCGFDAHRDDPIGGLSLSSGDFARLARFAKTFTPQPGRLLLFLEGGYSSSALRACTTSTLGALMDLDVLDLEPLTQGGPGLESLHETSAARAAALRARHDPESN
jgi:acetoin utilization deacetylase AcuC-like enzyme